MKISLAQIPSILLLWAQSYGISEKLWEIPRIQWELEQLAKGRKDPHGFFDSIKREAYNNILTREDSQAIGSLSKSPMIRLEFVAIMNEAADAVKKYPEYQWKESK